MFANFANRLGMDSDIAIAQPFTAFLAASRHPLDQCRKLRSPSLKLNQNSRFCVRRNPLWTSNLLLITTVKTDQEMQ